MRRAFIIITTFSIILGVIAISLNIIFGMNTVVYISQIENNGIIMYKYDFWGYLNNVYNTISDVAQLELRIPQDQWQTTNDLIADISNNIAYVFNRILIGINIMLYPIRIIFYAIKTILAFIGLPMLPGTYDNNGLKWLIDTTRIMVELQIPYVNQP